MTEEERLEIAKQTGIYAEWTIVCNDVLHLYEFDDGDTIIHCSSKRDIFTNITYYEAWVSTNQ